MEAKPDILAIAEVKPKNFRFDIHESDYKIEGYDSFSMNLDKDTDRGLLLLLKSYLRASIVATDSPFDEHLMVNIRIQNSERLLLGLVYRSPQSTDDNCNNLCELFKFIGKAKSTYKVIVGDFNYNRIDWETMTSPIPHERVFIDTVPDCFLTQHIKEPTRGRSDHIPSLIDLLFTNIPNMISNINHESKRGKVR